MVDKVEKLIPNLHETWRCISIKEYVVESVSKINRG